MIRLLAFGMPAAPEWIVISMLALVLFGPKKLPELARGLGKALGELQKAKEDFHREITGVPPLPKIQPQQGLQELPPRNSGNSAAPIVSSPAPAPYPDATSESQAVSETITVTKAPTGAIITDAKTE
jgi:sec-independent protein translocase protein TatA